MKTLIFSLLLILCGASSKAQTDEAMMKWLNGHLSYIDLSKSTSFLTIQGLQSERAIKQVKFDYYGAETISSVSNFSLRLNRNTFLKATIKNDLLVLEATGENTLSLNIADASVREKYKDVFTRYAYTRLNTNEADLPIYDNSKVDKKASFPGGQEKWRDFLVKYVYFAPAYKYDVPAGSYVGLISFVVTQDSVLKDIKKTGNNPKGIDEMMLYLIPKMPRWAPARLNGKNVSSTVTVKVTLNVTALTNSFEDQMEKNAAKEYHDITLNIANYNNTNPGHYGLKPLNLDDNSNTQSPTVKNDNDVKQPVVSKAKNPTDIKLGKWVTEPVAYFRSIGPFKDGLAKVSKGPGGFDDKWGYINTDGKIVVPLKYEEAKDFSNGRALVTINNKNGFIDTKGKLIVPLKWNYASSFSEGLAIVGNFDFYCAIDTTGKIVVPLKFKHLYDFHEGIASFEDTKENWGFIDKTGKPIIDLVDKYACYGCGEFSEGLMLMQKKHPNSKRGFLSKDGTEAINFIYDEASPFSEGLACVAINKKYGFINKEGKVVIPLEYDLAYPFRNGLATVKLQESYGVNERYGIIDKNGNIVAPLRYKFIYRFSEGVAGFTRDGKNGFINESGKEIIPPKYDEAHAAKNGLIAVSLGGSWGYIDLEGNTRIPFNYEKAEDFVGGLAEVVYAGNARIIDKSGKQWTAPKK